MKEVVAQLKNVSVSDQGKQILHDISLEAYRGEVLLITGPSGSGKTTVLRTLAGIESPDSGRVELFGHELPHSKRRRREVINRLGLGFQAHHLDTNFSVMDNLTVLAEMQGRQDTAGRADEVAAHFGLTDKLLESAAVLSGGEKQRVALGRLLVPRPELLLLDEPVASIDPVGKADALASLCNIAAADGMTIVMVSHDEEARDFSHREIIIQSGEVVNQSLPLE